jgi:cytochrome oxidase Cu insertion factor (SCO1/SenC/PrrC family)
MPWSLRSSLGAVLVVLLVAVACGEDGSNDAPQGDAQGPASADEAPADAAPDFEFDTFEGEVFSLAEQRGSPVVLNFWESW